MIVVVFDPGESTGWVAYKSRENVIIGGTCRRDHRTIIEILEEFKPGEVVLELFALYPEMAKQLAWNKFYPCEVIGVIKWWCLEHHVPCIEQQPSVKKYAGGFQEDWATVQRYGQQSITEHTKDAYLHLKYRLLRLKKAKH